MSLQAYEQKKATPPQKKHFPTKKNSEFAHKLFVYSEMVQ